MKPSDGASRVTALDWACARASLEWNKLYALLPDRQAEGDGLVRVIDEDGEDYLYPAEWFVAVELPKAVQASLLQAS